jgi:hypothetical protein
MPPLNNASEVTKSFLRERRVSSEATKSFLRERRVSSEAQKSFPRECRANMPPKSLLLIKLAIVACLFVFCHSAISTVHSTVLQSQPSNPAHQFSARRKKIKPWLPRDQTLDLLSRMSSLPPSSQHDSC